MKTGTHMKVRLESMTLNTPDVVAVFDRQ
jgi:hypothetical protein